jgi:hypothetical protein
VVSALGLEIAATSDPQIDALLGACRCPPSTGWLRSAAGFQTDAASYPLNPRLAHITNYREQSLDRRAQEGRLGLAQALTYSLNTWFAWSSELSDRSLFGRPDGGAADLQALDADALDSIRPIVAAAHRLGFEQTLRLDGGLLPADFNWRNWDALQATPAHMDPIHTRHDCDKWRSACACRSRRCKWRWPRRRWGRAAWSRRACCCRWGRKTASRQRRRRWAYGWTASRQA